MRTKISGLLAAITFVAATTASAQTSVQTGVGDGGSPHYKSDWTLGGAHITITYGRPSLKGRSDANMMPMGKIWRTGADEATVITTDKTLKFGSVTLAPGSYTINTEPGATSWQLVFGKLGEVGQWGIPYKPALELGRAPMTLKKTSAPVEQVTISIDGNANGGGGMLRVEWGMESASSPFTIGM